jgi:mono/diheme cytochrome c family protein
MNARLRGILAATSVGTALGCGGLMTPDAGPLVPVTLPTDPASLERGEYLAEHVLGCVACHTPVEHLVYGHPENTSRLGAGGAQFGDDGLKVWSSNITPAGIGHWSDDELFHAVTTGVTPDGRALFPIMPWGSYAHGATPDLLAALAYVRTLPAVENTVPERVLPGPLPIVVNFMPGPAENLAAAPDRADQVAYGAYLARQASCIDCHSEAERGTPIAGRELAGNFEFAMPGRPEFGKVYSANITPDAETGIGSWSRERFVGKFQRALDDPRNGAPIEAGQTWTVMPWRAYAGMTEEDLSAIFAYLQTVPAVSARVATFVPDAAHPAKGGPDPRPGSDPEVPRGALGALCDAAARDGLDPAGFYADPPDAALVAKATARAEAREFLELPALVATLAALPAPARQERVRSAATAHAIPERCAALVGATLPAAAAEEEEE